MSEQHDTQNPPVDQQQTQGTPQGQPQDHNPQDQQQQVQEPGQGAEPLVIRGVEIPADLSKVEDPDMRAYYEALIETEKAAGQQQDGGDQPTAEQKPTDGQSAGATQGQQKPGEGQQDTPMIPKARLDQVLSEKESLAQQAAYWRGIAEARTGVAQPGGQQQQAPQQGDQQQTTPQQQLEVINSAIAELAEKFDNGELTMKEFKAEELKLQEQAAALREAILAEKVAARIPQQEDLALQQRTAEIEAQHPYLPLVFPNKPEGQLTPIELSRQELIRSEATANVLAANPGIQPGPMADLLFRQELGKIADRYGALWFPDYKPAAPAAGTRTQQSQQQTALTDKQQQRLDKLLLADRQPPQIATLGTTGDGTNAYTPERIAQMSDDEYAKLPAAVRARLRGEV